ncbi:trypsin-like serine protease [Fluviispira multicolorata]|uniref:Trypsin-like serine protease n=1 Tax=Fluviispira multicolorata TaxID=2654512 RepID=A0A833JHD8_9BACT|nr:trypsin-like serine protease [Fluviispira multicolorata]KAB8033448.1 trypsin-like serine protease [Fluviispira multicolorata]
MYLNFKPLLFISIISLLSTGCQKIINKLRTEKICDSSSAFENNIYGGCEITDDIEQKFPAIKTSVYLKTSFEFGNPNSCSGNFISENIILTAAHCLVKKDYNYNEIEINKIEISNINKIYNYYFRPLSTSETFIAHPYFKIFSKYISESDENEPQKFGVDDFADIALIYSPVSASDMNAEVLSLTDYVLNDEKLFLVGYGNTVSKHDEKTYAIKKWGIAYATNEINEKINAYTFYDKNYVNWKIKDFWETNVKKYISKKYNEKSPAESFLITSGFTNENGVCPGDSGGAIFVKRDGKYVGAGITHAILNDDCSDKLSMNMKIGAYKEWILSESKKLSKNYKDNNQFSDQDKNQKITFID